MPRKLPVSVGTITEPFTGSFRQLMRVTRKMRVISRRLHYSTGVPSFKYEYVSKLFRTSGPIGHGRTASQDIALHFSQWINDPKRRVTLNKLSVKTGALKQRQIQDMIATHRK